MRDIRRLLTLLVGVFLFATFMLALMAAPGFLSDVGSTVPEAQLAARASR